MITDSLWKRRFHANPQVLGQTVRLDDDPHVIIGVLPPTFRFPTGEQLGPMITVSERAEIFKPLGLDWPKQSTAANFNYLAIVRLRPGAPAQRAQAEMTAAITESGRTMGVELKAHLTPMQDQITGNSRSALWLLMGAVGAVLLIVCVNLGNLMLVRASGRLRDAAVRRALGATRGQLFRPIMTESLILAAAGGVLGVLLAYAGVQVLVKTAPGRIPRLDEVHLDLITMLFAFLVAALCGILCGAWPAWRMTTTMPSEALKAGTRSTTDSGGRLRAREWLIGFEVALSTVLLVVAALLGVSFMRIVNVDRGFDVERIMTATVTLPEKRYAKDEQRRQFHEQTLERLQSAPGVKQAALVSTLPLRGEDWVDSIDP